MIFRVDELLDANDMGESQGEPGPRPSSEEKEEEDIELWNRILEYEKGHDLSFSMQVQKP